MRKKALAIFAILFLIFTALSFSLHIKNVRAQDDDFGVNAVYHTIGIMRNGYVVINDTVEIEIRGQQPNSFLIGFPYKYGSYVLKCIAYNETTVFPVNLGVPLGGRAGFYAVEVKPEVLPQNFTVLFILSNELLQQSGTTYTLDFPAYPSLTKEVKNCSVKIDLPTGAENINVVKGGEATNKTEFSMEKLAAYTYSAANVTFSLANDEIQLLDVKELKREIWISGTGEIQGSDSYYITNEAPSNLNYTIIILPPNASNPIAYDQFGRSMSSSWVNQTTGLYRVDFDSPPRSNESIRFNVKYSLPSQYLTAQAMANSFNASSILFQNINYYVEKASLTLTLPEGARTTSFENTFTSNSEVSRDVFQEILTVNINGASYLESVVASEKILQVSYEYNPLWLAFRPTLWMWALALVGCTVVFVWKRPKAAPVQVEVLGAGLQPEYVKSFVRMYEEKRKILFELDSLEARVRKGRIPRRRYKVQRRTFEMRLNTLERNLAELEDRMRKAGGLYADLMRQLEIAEAQISEAETNMKSIEVRHSQGTLSLEAYRKLLADYQQRKDKAQTTINGILLRLREETR
ncbi:MAG: hypothetical protein ACP5IM_00195 [Candidatus Bathyarchaeia archaeon]|nr:MAG: hypothetical protein C0195_03235 [Candidatus Bathyarchaeota archaeon]